MKGSNAEGIKGGVDITKIGTKAEAPTSKDGWLVEGEGRGIVKASSVVNDVSGISGDGLGYAADDLKP